MGIRNRETGQVTYEGLVLALGERNYRDDSDFYAVVWDPEHQRPVTVDYASTRFPESLTASIDATPDIRAAYDAYLEARAAEARARTEANLASRPDKGKLVKVIGGRKVPHGTVGRVFWTGHDRFARRHYSTPLIRTWYPDGEFPTYEWQRDPAYARVGIETATGQRHFLASRFVEVIAESEPAAA